MIFFNRGNAIAAHRAVKSWLAAALVVLVGCSFNLAVSQAQQPYDYESEAQVLTRGPVHEAFAGMVTFNPEPGVLVRQAPPEFIEEMPPETRPVGDNVAWIPGYWGWDDERSDYLWISGTWRDLPPGREWMAGYWAETRDGYQWTSGYWADAYVQETYYLPQPPVTLEVGPNIRAPSWDYEWIPGCWVWYHGRYAWRPGYWALAEVDWVWVPDTYVWTRRGCIYVEGYWDYPVERRGVLFAPVYFHHAVYSRRDYYYSPVIMINLIVFTDHLFLRPRYHHYYFGDYYALSYSHGGFFATFSFYSSRYGYDPIYSRHHWEHREDRDWEHRFVASYQYRRDHEGSRPPRTWDAQRSIDTRTAESREHRQEVAVSYDQVTRSTDSPIRFQPVAKEERQQHVQRGKDVRKVREQRRNLEATAAVATTQEPGRASEPDKVKLPKSPIAAKPMDESGRGHAPPKRQKPAAADLTSQPQPDNADRQPNQGRGNPQADQRQPDRGQQPAPTEVAPLDPARQPNQGRGNPQTESRQPDRGQQPAPTEVAPLDPARQPNQGRGNPQTESRQPDRGQQPAPTEVAPLDPARQPNQGRNNPQAETRQPDRGQQPVATEVAPLDPARQPNQGRNSPQAETRQPNRGQQAAPGDADWQPVAQPEPNDGRGNPNADRRQPDGQRPAPGPTEVVPVDPTAPLVPLDPLEVERLERERLERERNKGRGGGR